MHLWGQLGQLVEECLPLLPPWFWPSWLDLQHRSYLSVGREVLEEKADPQKLNCWSEMHRRSGQPLAVEEWWPLGSPVPQGSLEGWKRLDPWVAESLAVLLPRQELLQVVLV